MQQLAVDGRLFHALTAASSMAAAAGNARSPSDDLRVAGTTSANVMEDLCETCLNCQTGRMVTGC